VTELGIGTAYEGRSATIGSLSAALKTTLAPETRTRASAVAGTIRTDGAMVAATLLIDAISRDSREKPPASA
jgi:vancomycin aglycone glucosyltransferase